MSLYLVRQLVKAGHEVQASKRTAPDSERDFCDE
jgi:hypothetical protein